MSDPNIRKNWKDNKIHCIPTLFHGNKLCWLTRKNFFFRIILVYFKRKTHTYWRRLNTGPGPGSWIWENKDPWKTDWTLKTKNVTIVSNHFKDNGKVIHYHIKSRVVEGSIFVQMFKKCITNSYFENGKVSIKTWSSY